MYKTYVKIRAFFCNIYKNSLNSYKNHIQTKSLFGCGSCMNCPYCSCFI